MFKKRAIALILALSMLSGMSVTASAVGPAGFTDMPDDWSRPAIERAVSNGLLSGSNGRINASGRLTRAEMASIVVRAFGAEALADLSAYSDVSTRDWFYTDLQKAVAMGVISGSNGRLNPNAAITREEVCAVLHRAFLLQDGGSIPFGDASEVSDWARQAVAAMAAGGYLTGDSRGNVNPSRTITRAEFAQLLDNLVKGYPSGVAGGTIQGSAVVKVAGIDLSGAVIKGDLILADGLGMADVDLSGCTVEGRIIVRGGSWIQLPSGYAAGQVVAAIPKGKLTLAGKVDTVEIKADGMTLTVEDGTEIKTVEVLAKNVSIQGDGAVDSVAVREGAFGTKVTTSHTQIAVVENGGTVHSNNGSLFAGEAGTTDSLGQLKADAEPSVSGKPSGSSGSSSGGRPSRPSRPSGGTEQYTVTAANGQAIGTFDAGTQLTVDPANGEGTYTVAVSRETVIATPIRKGYTFTGWTVIGTTLTAQWVEESVSQGSFVVFDGTNVPDIFVSSDDHSQIYRAAGDLQEDVVRVTTKRPELRDDIAGIGSNAILAGSVEKSGIIRSLMDSGKLDEAKTLAGKWESYLIKIVEDPFPGVDKALVIAGSDMRGTIFGIYDVSEQIGVSPWYFWGDIAPKVQSRIEIATALKVQGEPSVKYRGIFINDEQNLVQWATDHGFDEGNRNLGPETYKSVYELLLRLKANYLWPGMHSETRLGAGVYGGYDPRYNATDYFNKYPENRENAAAYGIIVGTSHCEPMMRNGTAEWGEFLKENGYLTDVDFKKDIGRNKVDNWMYDYNKNNPGKTQIPRYDYSENKTFTHANGKTETQKEFIDRYWNECVEDYKDYAVSYTLGMRGIHDSGFRTANASSTEAKLKIFQEIIDKQVAMLENNQVNEDSISIFIPYKEVLTLYEAGLQLPDETVVVWAEDNHGFIRRFPTAEENQRSGGSGVYYHLSYEGVQSYQWMNSTPPALIFSEMGKAYESGIRQLWVLNVGDIKPSEIGMQFFLDMAWDVDGWNADSLMDADEGFLVQLAAKWFPDADSTQVGEMLREYYHLNYSRKPEHTTLSDSRGAVFDPSSYGDESMQRLADYQDLAERAIAITQALAEENDYQSDAFYEIIAYPIIGAYYNNLKYYHVQKNALCVQQGRLAAANHHAQMVDWAQEQETAATEYYNKGAFDGKWDLMMQPTNYLRTLQSKKPSVPEMQEVPYLSRLGIAPEGRTENRSLDFSTYLQDTHYIDLFNYGSKAFDYTISSDVGWVEVSEPAGTVYDEQRVFVTIDWGSLPAGDQTARLTVRGAGCVETVTLQINNPAMARETISGYAEADGYVAIEAEHFTENHRVGDAGFTVTDGLGRSGASVTAGPMGSARYAENPAQAPYMAYSVYFQTAGSFPTTVYRVPSLDAVGQRLALAVDDGAPVLLSGQKTAEEGTWSRNITNGIEKLSTALTVPSAGYHTIKLYMVDPGVSVDRIVINTGGEQPSNQGPRESYHSVYNRDPSWTPSLLSMERFYFDAYLAEVEAGLTELPEAGRAKVQAELAAVKVAAAEPGDDTLRRCRARLSASIAEVNALANAGSLLEAALQKGQAIADMPVPSIAVYRSEALEAFRTSFAELKSRADAVSTDAERLALYAEIAGAIQQLEGSRMLTVTASSEETKNGNLISYMVDGDRDTRWAASGSEYPQTVTIDLGAVYSLDQIQILWYNNASNKRAYKYNIEVSRDGDTYQKVVDRSGNTTQDEVTDSLNQTAGRYIRIQILGDKGSASIYEIMVEGSALSDLTGEQRVQLQSAVSAARQALENAAPQDYTVDSRYSLLAAVETAEALLAEGGTEQQVQQSLQALADPGSGLEQRSYIVQDTFDSAQDLNNLSGWQFIETGGIAVLESDGDNKYLKLTQSKQGNGLGVEARRSFPEISGKVYVEAKVRSDTPATFFGAPYLYQNSSSNTILGALALRDNGEIKATYQKGSSSMSKVGDFAAGEWITVSLIVDSVTQQMDVYIDGRLAKSGLPMRNPLSALGMLRFYSDDKTSGRPLVVAYVDDVFVYQAVETAAPKIKVACVGDSITYGSNGAGGRVDEADRYPSQLAQLLGREYQVGNFGVSGACMLTDGTDKASAVKGYVKQAEYENSKSFQPDVVVIMLGTNDSKALNWDSQSGEYVADALSLIESYRALDSRPEIYLASSPTVLDGSNSYGIQGDVVSQQVVSLQRQIALAADTGFVDVHTATAGATEQQFPDKVHGNQKGYQMIAEVVSQALLAEETPKAAEILRTESAAVQAVAGTVPELPDFVTVHYADGNTGIAQVEWQLDGLDFIAETVIVPGALKGLPEQSVSAKVTVVDGAEDMLRELLKEAAAKNAEEYTVDSYDALQSAAQSAEAVLENGGDVLAAKDVLQTTLDGLEGRRYLVNDDFDDAENLDDLADWERVGEDGIVELIDLNNDGNKCLKIQQENKTDNLVEMRRTLEPAASGKIYVEARVRSDTPDAMLGAPFLYEKAEDISNSKQIRTAAYFRDNGRIDVSNQFGGTGVYQVGSFSAGDWNTICLIVDSSTQKTQVYLNGERVATDLTMRSTLTTLSVLRFYTDDKNTSRNNLIGYIDDVRVYQAA